MKMKRLLASVLTLLLVVSLLPIGVMAEDVVDNPAGSTTNISESQTMNRNRGEVGKNEGVIKNNSGSVIDNANIIDRNVSGDSTGTVGQKDETGKVVAGTGNNGTIKENDGGVIYMNNETGIVEDNYRGTIEINNGTVGQKDETGKVVAGTGNHSVIETNNGTVFANWLGGEVGKLDGTGKVVAGTGNNGTIEINSGTVITNNETGTVVTNAEEGEIETNNGTVGKKDENGKAVAGTGNSGTIETNNGTVITNNETGTVVTNAAGGKIETNNGTVNINNEGGTVVTNAKGGEIETNNGTVNINNEGGTVGKKDENGNAEEGTGNNSYIETNNGTVISNNETGIVETNAATGTIEVNDGSLIVNHEDATVGINNGDIELNYGDIDTNNYNVAWNYGTVETNNYYVAWNYGTVETNTIDGIVWNETTQDQNGQNVTGTVTNNYGTMITNTGKVDEDGRSIYKTEYGVQVQNTDGGAGTKLLQAVENTIVKLADLFKRDGYELVGYNDITPEPEYPDEDWDGPVEYALNNNPSAQELSATEFQATRPSILSLIWKAIVKPAAPSGSSGEPEPKTVQNNIPTTLSADQVKVGAYVRRGNLLFRIIEVGDDYIRVATVPKLSEQALADMLGFLKQHLSDAQIAKINGEPKLLEQELVTYFFGGTFEHISFYAAPDLFA